MNKFAKLRAWLSREKLLATARKPRVKKTGLVLLSLYIVITATLFFAGPPLIKSYLTDSLAQQIGRKVSVGRVQVNPLMLSVTLQDLRVLELDGQTPYLGLREFYVNAQLASLVLGGPVFSEVRMVAPYVHVVRYPDASYNFEKSPGPLLQRRAAVKKGEAKPLSFSINNIQISDGKIEFEDQLKGRRHTVHDLKVALPFLSNLFYRVDDYVQPAFSAVVNGAPLQLAGQSKPFEVNRESSLQLKLRQLQLDEYLTYVPKKLHFTLPGGTLDADIKIAFLQPPDAAPLLRLSGTTTLHNLALHEAKDTPTLRLKRLEVVLDSIEPLLKRYSVRRITASAAEIFVRRDRQGRINLAQLVEPEDDQDPLPYFLISEATLNQSTLHVRDEYRAQPFETTFQDIQFAAHNISSEKGTPGQVTLSAAGPGAATFKAATEVVLQPLTLAKLSAELNELRVPQARGKGDMLHIGRLALSGGALDLERRSVSLEQVALAGSKINVQRDQQGRLNLSQLADSGPQAPATPGNKAQAAWQYAVNKLTLDDVGVHWRDDLPAGGAALGIDQIQAQVEGISSAPKSVSKLALKARVAKGGSLALDGNVVLAPLSAQLQLDARGLPILPLQPYFADQVHVSVTSGSLSARGKLDAQLAPAPAPRVQYRGTLQVNKFASIDNLNRNDFLKWETLHVGGLNVVSAPLNVAIGEIALSNFYSRLIINPDGSLNVQHVLGKKPGSEQAVAGDTGKATAPVPAVESAAPKPAPVPIKIGRITLQGGQVNFSDRFIKPNYSANLTQIGGSVSELSSDLASTAAVALRGKVDDAAPLEILGKINPLSGNLFLDLTASAKGIDLPTATPYSARYAGYPIIKGKLSMDVKYHIEDKKLTAENHVVLDQLTFGERVNNPDATKLPVLLAVALLRDRNGVIDINLPISGSLDDPKFSIGGIIVRVIVNLIGKALTSPFALLGSLFPNSEQLSYIEFEEGQARLDTNAATKIQSLAQALEQRPALKLDITGRVDPQRDKEGLRRYNIERKVQAVKFEALKKQENAPTSLDEVKVDPAEYPKLLKEAYGQEKFAKPRNLIGFAKDLPVPEMEKLMLTNATISDDDLRQLALRRARVVADALLRTGKVGTERLFVLEPKLTVESPPEPSKDSKEKLKDSRVDFSLK